MAPIHQTFVSQVLTGNIAPTRGNGVVESAIRVLKKQLLWLRFFAPVEELRLGLATFATQYNAAWP